MLQHESVESPLPIVMGNEEESGMIVRIDDQYDEPYELAENLARYIPRNILGSHDEYLTNGFRIYVGGCEDFGRPTNIERATPECILPEDLTKYIRVGELVMDQIVGNYIEEASDLYNSEISVRLQRRVVDSLGNRKGCHDNFCIENDSEIGETLDISPQLKQFIATRNFITGAGHFTEDSGVYYSQKIDGLVEVNGYGYRGTVGRVVQDIDYMRLEIRCNDINISDWATQIRLGGMGLMLALSELGELESLEDYSYYASDNEYLGKIKKLNMIKMNQDGDIELTDSQIQGLDYQQRVAELALKSMSIHLDLPHNYYRIAQEIYSYCDDFRRVISGKADIKLLADRADWAAKFAFIRDGIESDRDFGIKRDFGDVKSRAADLRYDFKEIKGDCSGLISKTVGYGFKLRDRGKFRLSTNEKQINSAQSNPPEDTRAKLRSQLLEDILVKDCYWSSISFNSLDDKNKIINLAPRDTSFTGIDLEKIFSTKEI
jgi:proteasome accessory factor A